MKWIRQSAGLAVLLFVLLAAGCTQSIGTGVVLWSPDEELLPTGILINIIDESLIRKKYFVTPPGTREKMEIDLWRVKLFSKKGDAEEFMDQYTPYHSIYATSERQGHIMRADPWVEEDNIVYKLRLNQEVKVIGKTDELEKIGRFEGYWYHLLTDDGESGYSYESYLNVYALTEDQQKNVLNNREEENPALTNFLENPWRPRYYYDMYTKNNIDLDNFRLEYGLFPDPETKSLSLKTAEQELVENFTDINNIGGKKYSFIGSSFQITMTSEYFISVQFNHEGEEHSQAFIKMDEDLEEIIENEKERRQNLYTAMFKNGPFYQSQVYGMLEFTDENGFQWTEKSSLITRNLISENEGTSGIVIFKYFPGPLIKTLYDGIITFRFATGKELSFLFIMKYDSIQMLYIPDNAIGDNKIIETDQFFDPLVLYFNTVIPEEELLKDNLIPEEEMEQEQEESNS